MATILEYRQYLETIKEHCKELEKTLIKKLKEQNTLQTQDFLSSFEDIKGVKVIIQKIDQQEVDQVKDLSDRLCERMIKAIVFFAIVSDKIIFICKSIFIYTCIICIFYNI